MKFITVTGVSTGIGYGTTHRFIEKGYHVLGSVRSIQDGNRLGAEFGGRFTPLVFDVTDESSIKKAAAVATDITRGAGLSGLINNAGIAVSGPLLHASVEEFRHQLEVNVIGQLSVTRAFAPLLGAVRDYPHPPGKIVFISSSSGVIPHLFLGAYTASKHALEGMARVLGMELRIYGIEVIVIGPGAVNSAIWDKDSAQKAAALYRTTDYASAVERFQQYFISSGRKGYDVQTVGKKIVAIFEKKNHLPRYALVKHRWKKWNLPRLLLPTRLLDEKITRPFGLDKKMTER